MKPRRPSKRTAVRPLRRASASRRYSRQLPEQRRTTIIEAAIRCLDQGGAANLTTTQVMREAKVSRGLVNHYFPSMTDLLVEAYKAMIAGLSEKAMDDMVRRSGSAGLELKAMVDVACGPLVFERVHNQAWIEVWALKTTMPELRAVHRRVYLHYRLELTSVIQRIARERKLRIDADRLAAATIAFVDGLWLNWSIDPRFVSAKEARRACYAMLEARLGPL